MRHDFFPGSWFEGDGVGEGFRGGWLDGYEGWDFGLRGRDSSRDNDATEDK
ncbi:MAG: hypothetical protein IPL78_16455 [Chloroflexi bacterium]|nr:hypothetical protein [Chloroflexota bacterium]